MGAKVHYCVHKNPPQIPILSQIHPVHTSPPYLPKIHSNIILLSTRCLQVSRLTSPMPDHTLLALAILSPTTGSPRRQNSELKLLRIQPQSRSYNRQRRRIPCTLHSNAWAPVRRDTPEGSDVRISRYLIIHRAEKVLQLLNEVKAEIMKGRYTLRALNVLYFNLLRA